MTTVKRGGSRTPTATGCGASSTPTRGTSKPSKPTTTPRTSVSSGCGSSSTASTGWKPKGSTGKKEQVSPRSQDLLDRAGGKGKSERRTTSTACGTSTPSKPAKPAKPAPAPKPIRSGC